MTFVARYGAVVVALLATACEPEKEPPIVQDCTNVGCTAAPALDASFVTLLRLWGPELDRVPWRVTVDERACSIVPALDPSGALTIVCAEQGAGDRVPVFVSVANDAGGLGRMIRVDTLGRAVSHVRVEREGALVDEFDHAPTLARSPVCAAFGYDAGGERALPEVAGVP